MASLNKVMIIGSLGRDPEISCTPAGMAIAKMSVATSEKNKQGEEKTEWHRVTCFNKTAENCGRFISKGSQVYVEGRLETSQYEKDGITRYSTEIKAFSVTFLGGKKQGGNQQQAQPQQQQQPQNPGYNQHPSYGGVQNYGQGQQSGGYQQGGYNQGRNEGGHPQASGGFNPPPDDD